MIRGRLSRQMKYAALYDILLAPLAWRLRVRWPSSFQMGRVYPPSTFKLNVIVRSHHVSDYLNIQADDAAIVEGIMLIRSKITELDRSDRSDDAYTEQIHKAIASLADRSPCLIDVDVQV